MIEDKKTYNGHAYSGNLLSACLNGYEQGKADAKQEDLLDIISKGNVPAWFEEEVRKDERAKVLDELNNKIEEILKEPQYQHDGEDWMVGLIIAQDVLNELKEQKNE